MMLWACLFATYAFFRAFCAYNTDPWTPGQYEMLLWENGPMLDFDRLVYCPPPSPPERDALPTTMLSVRSCVSPAAIVWEDAG